MPDPHKKTVSATQTPALFGVSPYLTKWMLLRHFIHGDSIESPEHNRMNWGSKLQPLILEQVAQDVHLEVRPNKTDAYVVRGLVGCTRDAEIICPDRGPGSLEIKCVFDYATWMQEWAGGKTPPKHIEIQLQQQMLVGEPGDKPHDWGILAVWCCGDMHYFERSPIPELWEEINAQATQFFADVAAGREGDPFGVPVEWPLLSRLFAPKPLTVIDLTTRDDAHKIADDARMMAWHAAERLGHEKGEKALKAKLKALIGDNEEALLPGGIKIRQKKVNRKGYTVGPSSYVQVEVYVPATAPKPTTPASDILAAG